MIWALLLISRVYNHLKKKIKDQFDHTFLVNEDDPLLSTWEHLHSLEALNLKVMDNVGMESSAKLIWGWANEILFERDKGRTCCWRAQALENVQNSAYFELIPDWYKGVVPNVK